MALLALPSQTTEGLQNPADTCTQVMHPGEKKEQNHLDSDINPSFEARYQCGQRRERQQQG